MANRKAIKSELRNKIKAILHELTLESKELQSQIITEKILKTKTFQSANNVSIYLSTASEVNTKYILGELFRLEKNVFVPSYRGNTMKMLLLKDWNDFETLPFTKWQIKQPNFIENRKDGMDEGIDFFIIPGVAFTLTGGRVGHGMGYYDKYLENYFMKFPNKKTILMGLAFKEQIVADDILPMEESDVRLDCVLTV